MGKIIWLTGNSGAGKTTLAYALSDVLRGYVVLDGDEMRDSVSIGLGYSSEGRFEANMRVARLAKVIAKQEYNVIIAVIAPFQSIRDEVEHLIDVDWVYLKRDSLGHRPDYPYEAPQGAFSLDIDTMTVREEVEKVIAWHTHK